MMQIGQWVDGIPPLFFFCFLCYPYAIHFLLTLAPFILIYSPITTSTHATLFASLRIYCITCISVEVASQWFLKEG
jgi:hypothetical protein